MIEHAIRLIRGQDLHQELSNYCLKNNINTAIVLSGVGCVLKLRMRLAKAIEVMEVEEDYEIVSLTGTISNGAVHVHIALSDDKGQTIGGHLMPGTIINTTCELVLGQLETYQSSRVFDEATGYDEIIFDKEAQ